jgi:hypothetical protein
MMDQNGAKLKREHAVYAVMSKLIPFFTGRHLLPPIRLVLDQFFV